MFLFPRLSLIFCTTIGGGFLYWLGLIVCPRILVAVIANNCFYIKNPSLVILTWIWAITGDFAEKYLVSNIRKKQI